YKDEMGITVDGFTNPAVPGVVFPLSRSDDDRLLGEENPPQGNVALLTANPVGSPNEPDDEDLVGFTDFITFLGPPPRGPITADARQGEAVFQAIGCAVCHVPSVQTSLNLVRALNYVRFQPYSDFLLHDMGPLGDGIGGEGEEGSARGSEMRTAPLWGLRALPIFLHDGRATTVEMAIRMHEGQGRFARDRFAVLPGPLQQKLLAFLHSL
ncbi:MAG: di-heme oxidoredictase family protein, partial [Singulisphaera sp.]